MINDDVSKVKQKITPIFLIGAMKSGTSTVYKHLEKNKEICFGPAKELEFFSVKMGYSKYKLSSFWDLFNLESHHKYIFDGSTGYTKYPIEEGVPKRIYDYGLKPKFIYIVRNPFDRIESHYNYMLKDMNWDAKITSNHLIDVSNYYLQLKQYENYFDKNDFLILDFDELINNHESCLEKLFNHIGIKNFDVGDEVKSNTTRPVNRKQIQLKKKLVGRFKFLPPPIKNFAKKVILKLFRKKKKKLKLKQKRIIHSKLKNDMKLFKINYGFPVEKWGF